jgi:hypothetical protein
MARAADGKKLGQPLDNAEDDRFKDLCHGGCERCIISHRARYFKLF